MVPYREKSQHGVLQVILRRRYKMGWIEPKTDWYGYTDSSGNYQGDRFNAVDYNRIKNNIEHLRILAIQIYTEFEIEDMGPDKTYTDYPYADEINTIESNLETVSKNTFGKNYGAKQTYKDNGAFIDFNELNRIESAVLDLYNNLSSQYDGRRLLTFMLGAREVF